MTTDTDQSASLVTMAEHVIKTADCKGFSYWYGSPEAYMSDWMAWYRAGKALSDAWKKASAEEREQSLASCVSNPSVHGVLMAENKAQ